MAATNPNALLDPIFPAAPVAIGDPVGGKDAKVPVPVPVGRIEIVGAVPDGTGMIVTEPPVGNGAELVGATGVDVSGCAVTVTGARVTVRVTVDAGHV